MSYITKIKGSNNTTYDIKDTWGRNNWLNITGTAGSTASGAQVSTKWTGNIVDDEGHSITPYDGMRLMVRVPATGVSTYGVILSIDNGTTWHTVAYNANTVLTTHYAVNTVMLLVYNASLSMKIYPTPGQTSGVTVQGIWQCLSNYVDGNTWLNLTHNSGTYIAKTIVTRYSLLLSYSTTELLSVSSGNGTSGHVYDTTNDFDPFGQILYLNSSANTNNRYCAAGEAIAASVLTEQYRFDMRYTFNGGTTMVTANKDLYLVAEPQSNGRAKIHGTAPLAQDLPTTEDGLLYIYLGHTYSGYQVEIYPMHPIYYYSDGKIKIWTNSKDEVTVTMDLTESSSSGSATEYTVSNASHTPTQVASLISSGKNVKIAANIDGVSINLDCTHNDSNGLVFSCATVTLALMMYLVVGDTTNDSWIGLSSGLAEYGHHHGYISSTGTLTDTAAPVVNGDAIIVRGSGSNIVLTSDITFDGSTTNQVLSKKGTWVALPTNTDILVKQTSDTTSTSEFPLLASAQSSPTSGTAYEAKYNANIKIKPSNGTLTATNLVGDGMNIGGIVSYCSCTTAAATAAKQLTVNGTNGSSWTLSTGKIIALSSCTYSNTAANVTFNVNNTGAYSIYYDNAVYSGSDPFITGHEGGRTAYYMFDGTYWVWMGRTQGGVEIQYDSSTSSKWPVAFVPFATTSTSTGFNSLRFNGNIYANPGNGWLYAEKFIGGIDGASSRSAVAIANNDALLIADANQSNRITPSTTKFGTSTTTFLRNDGQWGTPTGSGDTGYASSTLSDNTSTITFGSTKEYQVVAVTGSTQTFNVAVDNRCTNYLLVTNGGSSDCAVAIGVQSGTLFTSVVKPSAGITVGVGKAVELSFISISGGTILVVTVSAEMEIDTLS